MKNCFKGVLAVIILVLVAIGCKTAQTGDSILFSDNFSDASTLASNWIIHDDKNPSSGPSLWVLQEEKLMQKSNIFRSGADEYKFFEGTHIVTKIGSDWGNYEFSVDFTIAGDDDGVGVLFRYQDPEHYYRFVTVTDPGNKGPFRKLQVKDGDKYSTIAESDEGYDSAKPHKVKVRLVGKSIVILFDDKEILSAEDSRYSSGRIGLMSYAEQPVFDNVLVIAR
ncbi:hypothetical protein KAU32_01995 [bacterium]|nr:hypothetical protein [bacterium]